MRRFIGLACVVAFFAACGGSAPSGDVPSGDAAVVADGSETGGVSCLSMLGNACGDGPSGERVERAALTLQCLSMLGTAASSSRAAVRDCMCNAAYSATPSMVGVALHAQVRAACCDGHLTRTPSGWCS